jgi:hypothetical protein
MQQKLCRIFRPKRYNGSLAEHCGEGRDIVAEKKILLSDLIDTVTGELLKAQNNALKRGVSTMLFEECEFEFGIEAEKEAGGGVSVWVIDVSAGVKKTETNTIRVKFKANPEHHIQAPIQQEGSGPALKKQK